MNVKPSHFVGPTLQSFIRADNGYTEYQNSCDKCQFYLRILDPSKHACTLAGDLGLLEIEPQAICKRFTPQPKAACVPAFAVSDKCLCGGVGCNKCEPRGSY